MARAGGDGIPLRVQCAVYGLGTFSTTMHFMAVTIVPLWVVQMDLSPFVLGLVLGARPILSLFLSIHMGALMDRLGARRIMLGVALAGMVTPLFYPMLPWAWAAFTLQILWGFADSTGWLGAQILVGKLMQGRTRYAGRLSAVSRAGNIIGPPLVGAAWDAFGPWGAFGVAAAWGLGAVVSALMLPGDLSSAASSAAASPARRAGWRALLPDPSDYVSAFRMLAVPTVAVTVAIGMMTHLGNNIQSTFYVVWLNEVGT